MNVVLVDWKAEQLKAGVETVKAVDGVGKVLGFDLDLSVIDNVESLRDQVLKEFPEVRASLISLRVQDHALTRAPGARRDVKPRYHQLGQVVLHHVLSQRATSTMGRDYGDQLQQRDNGCPGFRAIDVATEE
jgi:hypothetical protein